MTPRTAEKGYVLIEAIVALAIIAISSATLIAVFADGTKLRAQRLSAYERYAAADVILAKAKAFAEAGAPVGEQRGAEGSLEWRTSMAAVSGGESQQENIELVRIEVEIGGGQGPGRSVQLVGFVARPSR